MKFLPTLTAINTRIIFLVVTFGLVLTPFMDQLIANPHTRLWIQVIFGFFGLLNHEITAKSNPDGTPAPPHK